MTSWSPAVRERASSALAKKAGYALFYPGGAMGRAGMFGRSIEDVDRQQIFAAIERLLKNDDGRARGTVTSVYTMAKHADRVAGLIRKLEDSPDDSRPLRTLDLPQEKGDK